MRLDLHTLFNTQRVVTRPYTNICIVFATAILLSSGMRVHAQSQKEAMIPWALPWKLSDHASEVEKELTGFTRPSRSLNVMAQVSAKVTEVLVEEGDCLAGKANSMQKVILLDDALIKSELESMAALLEVEILGEKTAELRLDRLRNELDYNEKKYKRARELHASTRASDQELDDAKFAADQSRISTMDALHALSLAKAAVRQSRAQLAQSTERLKQHTVHAPAGWIVEERSAQVGLLAGPGESLMVLLDLSQVQVHLRLTEQEISRLRQLDHIDLEVPLLKKKVRASLDFVSNQFDPVTRKKLVKLGIASKEFAPISEQHIGGLEVVLRIRIADASGGFLVPHDFIQTRFEQSFLVSDSGSRHAVTVLSRGPVFSLVLPSLPSSKDFSFLPAWAQKGAEAKPKQAKKGEQE